MHGVCTLGGSSEKTWVPVPCVEVIHTNSKHTSRFIAAYGVYFIKMLVPKKYTRKSTGDPHPQNEVFARQD